MKDSFKILLIVLVGWFLVWMIAILPIFHECPVLAASMLETQPALGCLF